MKGEERRSKRRKKQEKKEEKGKRKKKKKEKARCPNRWGIRMLRQRAFSKFREQRRLWHRKEPRHVVAPRPSHKKFPMWLRHHVPTVPGFDDAKNAGSLNPGLVAPPWRGKKHAFFGFSAFLAKKNNRNIKKDNQKA